MPPLGPGFRMVTGGLTWPFIVTVTGTSVADPASLPSGTMTATWYLPALPGITPLDTTVAAMPLIVTVAVLTVMAGVSDDRTEPTGMFGVTAPSPVH